MDLPDRIERLVAPTVEAMGYDIVRVQLHGQQGLQIMAERRDGKTMQVADCAEISRAVTAVLEVEDPVLWSYALEVSSPGIDRPLVKLGDYERFAGFEAKIETDKLVDGRKRFRGRLLGVEGETVRIQTAENIAELPFRDIRRGKLVLTDELMAATDKH
ncbi:MAG: ribosome maturation factor RimP [Rhodospirillales bacterium RIFCSPLOWO2_12_FULL_58_28]|nr:MAG: ribosome maturation factor RimP [Rhodospirillales bacterium RIFCSPLOWO2_02_FULL_58_16]OHC77867.1 MAG: ribosome maturation factor RimP [Rhodospirillales bacterium RIFCSPLOWO2_12_FULL_58_28]